MLFKNSQHYNSGPCFRDRQSEKIFCDGKLRAEGRTYDIHKCVVGVASDFLRKTFVSEVFDRFFLVTLLKEKNQTFYLIFYTVHTILARRKLYHYETRNSKKVSFFPSKVSKCSTSLQCFLIQWNTPTKKLLYLRTTYSFMYIIHLFLWNFVLQLDLFKDIKKPSSLDSAWTGIPSCFGCFWFTWN